MDERTRRPYQTKGPGVEDIRPDTPDHDQKNNSSDPEDIGSKKSTVTPPSVEGHTRNPSPSPSDETITLLRTSSPRIEDEDKYFWRSDMPRERRRKDKTSYDIPSDKAEHARQSEGGQHDHKNKRRQDQERRHERSYDSEDSYKGPRTRAAPSRNPEESDQTKSSTPHTPRRSKVSTPSEEHHTSPNPRIFSANSGPFHIETRYYKPAKDDGTRFQFRFMSSNDHIKKTTHDHSRESSRSSRRQSPQSRSVGDSPHHHPHAHSSAQSNHYHKGEEYRSPKHDSKTYNTKERTTSPRIPHPPRRHSHPHIPKQRHSTDHLDSHRSDSSHETYHHHHNHHHKHKAQDPHPHEYKYDLPHRPHEPTQFNPNIYSHSYSPVQHKDTHSPSYKVHRHHYHSPPPAHTKFSPHQTPHSPPMSNHHHPIPIPPHSTYPFHPPMYSPQQHYQFPPAPGHIPVPTAIPIAIPISHAPPPYPPMPFQHVPNYSPGHTYPAQFSSWGHYPPPPPPPHPPA